MAGKKRAKRDWYVAYGDVSGEYEGGPLTYDASQVYGPFTAAQAQQLSELCKEFPHATKDLWLIKVSKASFRSVLHMIRVDLAEAKAEEASPQSED